MSRIQWDEDRLNPYLANKPRLDAEEIVQVLTERRGYFAVREPDRDTDHGWGWYILRAEPGWCEKGREDEIFLDTEGLSVILPDGGHVTTVQVYSGDHGTRLPQQFTDMAVARLTEEEFCDLIEIAERDAAQQLHHSHTLTKENPAFWRREAARNPDGIRDDEYVGTDGVVYRHNAGCPNSYCGCWAEDGVGVDEGATARRQAIGRDRPQ